MKTKILVLSFVGIFLGFFSALAINSTTPELKVFNNKSAQTSSFFAFDQGFAGGGSVALADFNNDGKSEIIVGAGQGGGPQVRVFSSSGKVLGEFFAFDTNHKGGVEVAIGDVDNDKKKEIVVAPMTEKEPWVVVFDVKTYSKKPWKFTAKSSFLAYNNGFKGGVNLAVGNVLKHSGDEIVTASGLGSSGQIRIFDVNGNDLGWQVFPFASDFKGGADVAVANVDGGKYSEIIAGILHYGEPRVKVYRVNYKKEVLGDFLAFNSGYKEGVNVAGGNISGNNSAEVLVGANGGGGQVRAFNAYSGKAIRGVSFFPYGNEFHGGVQMAVGNLDKYKKIKEIAVFPGRKTLVGRMDLYKYVEINIGEQKLYAYLAGKKVNEIFVSTGVYKYPTPIGDFKIYYKKLKDDMKYEYGKDHPDNYDLKNVPHVMYFFEGYSLHGTYWHSNFGYRMSHGCVNLSMPNAAWLYGWVNVGDVVLVRP